MGNTRHTGYLQNIVQYDASNNITLPARLAVTGTVAINNTTPYDTTQFSLDVNGGLIVKNINKTAQFVLINSNPATGGNNAFVVHTVGGTSGSSYADIQGYYGTSIAGSTVIRLNPLGGNVLVGSLAGTGSRMVVADSTGVLSTQAIVTLGDLSGVPTSRTITINGTSQDLSTNRTFTLYTDDISEDGSPVNLWFTNARARAAISVSGSLSYDSATGVISYTTPSTSGITEGTNLYYTDARVGTYLTNNSYATQNYVSTQINNLVNGAPGLLDTLDELAQALGDDPNFSTTVTTALSNRLRIDVNNQGLTSTQKGYGRTNLGVVIGTDVQAWDADLDAIAALSGTSGFLKKTAANTWSLDTNTYLTSYTETDTLANVTSRGASTSTAVTFSGGASITGLTVAKSSNISTITFPAGSLGNDPAFIQHEESTSDTGIMRFSASDNTDGSDHFIFGATQSGTYSGTFRLRTNGVIDLGTWQGSAIADSYISSASTWNAKQGAITLTTNNASGAATFSSNTLNIPNYTLSGLGGVPTSRTITINGTALDLSADRSWSVGTVIGNSNILTDANGSNVTINGGYFTGFNPSNIPAGQSSGDWGLSNFPIWTGNSSAERYAVQLAANIDDNAQIFIRKFKFFNTVSLQTWYALLHSGNFNSYALPLSGGTLTGRVTWTTTTSPISFQNNGNTGTYTQTSIYANQNNNSGDTANGIFIERGYTDTSNTELRHFVIGSRGGGIQWKLDGPGNSTQNGSVIASGLDISNNSLLNKVKYTQGNYRVYRNLARFDNYNNGTGALAIYTNIPWNAANMLTIQIKGYRYGDRAFELTCSVYAGEGNFYSPFYYSLAADSIFGGYTWYRDANNKIVLVLGNTSGNYGVQLWVSEYKQGFQSLDTTYADGWSVAKITSTTGLSNGTAIINKNYTTGVIAASDGTFTNTGTGVFNSQLKLVNTTNASSLIEFSNTLNGYCFGFTSTGGQRFSWYNGAPTEIANLNGGGRLSLNEGVSTLAVSNLRGSAAVTAFALKVTKQSAADSGGHTTLIGMGCEDSGWSRSAIGHTRTSSYDRGYFGIYVSANNSDGTELTTSDLRVKVDHIGHVVPAANGTQNLGSSSERWATVFTSDLSLSNGIGDYTIVEGENDLFLYNNKQNKVYKFMLQEVDPKDATPKMSE